MRTATGARAASRSYENSLGGARAWFAHNGLTRPREGKLIAGFARRYGLNVLVARVVAVVGVVVLTRSCTCLSGRSCRRTRRTARR